VGLTLWICKRGGLEKAADRVERVGVRTGVAGYDKLCILLE